MHWVFVISKVLWKGMIVLLRLLLPYTWLVVQENVGHSDVGCSSVHRPHISMTFSGDSFSPCFFRHLGQKIAKTISSYCFFF
jgi:hypothetical protein